MTAIAPEQAATPQPEATQQEAAAAPVLPPLEERMLMGALAAGEVMSMYLGDRLGLYRALAGEPLTVTEFAQATGTDRRYAREWLEQQAAASVLTVIEPDEAYPDFRFVLPREHIGVLVDPEDPSHMAGFARAWGGIARVLPALVDAFRTGAGVPFADYGEEVRTGQGAMNRPMFTHELDSWFAQPAIAEIVGKPRVRIADLGAGEGWSSLAIARAVPNAEVVAIDADEPSAETARRNARAAGLAIEARAADAASLASYGPFQLVTIFEALHDMARPAEVLASARQSLAPGGAMLVMDERVADRFTGPADEIERLMYTFSVLHCLPASRAEQPSAALGTVLRRPILESLAKQAGFAEVEVLPIENLFFRFYLLRP